MATGRGSADLRLKEADIAKIVEEGIPARLVDGKRVLVLTPDATRTCPLPLMARDRGQARGPARRAAGLHGRPGHAPAMSEDRIDALFGIGPGERETVFRGIRFLNHRWDLPDTLQKLGTIDEARSSRSRTGSSARAVDVVINRAVYDYDLILIARPGLPARGGRVLGRQQVPVPGDFGRRLPPLLPLAGRGHHLPGDHRHQGHTAARAAWTAAAAMLTVAALVPCHGGGPGRAARRALRRHARRRPGPPPRTSPRRSTSCTRRSRSTRCWAWRPRCTTSCGPRAR